MTEREITIFEWAIYSLWSVSLLFFFFFFSFFCFSLLVCSGFLLSPSIFLCSFLLSLHFSSFFSSLVRPRSVAFCFRFSQSASWFSRWYLVPQLAPNPTDSSRLCPGYIFVWRPPAFAVIYTGAPLDWRLGRGSICYKCANLFYQ